MKFALSAAATLLLFSACQKEVTVKNELVNVEAVSSNALAPLPCHSISLITDYTTSRGQQPPFTFTKTLYSDSRVKTIKMLSRAQPNHPQFKRQMWETMGTFTYATNKAIFTGTKELWEYYITPGGLGAKKSLGKKNIQLRFEFNSRGQAFNVWNELGQWDPNSLVYRPVHALGITYGSESGYPNTPPLALYRIYVAPGSDEGIPGGYKTYIPNSDQWGNPQVIAEYSGNRYPGVEYTYDYNIPSAGKNYSFIPSQNLISFEYNMCEVMQWLPQPSHQRKDATGVFYLADGGRVNQKQYYKNYKFDAKGNQLSVTYADNVLQKTTWSCNN